MSNIIRSTTALALHVAKEYIRSGGIVVDATCGNGYDTLALAKAIRALDNKTIAVSMPGEISSSELSEAPENGTKRTRLLAFDIQQAAISATETLLRDEGFGEELDRGNIRLIHDSHENMKEYLLNDRMNDCLPGEDMNAHIPNRNMYNHLPNEKSLPVEADLIMFNLGYLPGGNKEVTTSAESTLQAVKTGLGLLAVDGSLCVTMYSGHPEGAREKELLLDLAGKMDPRKYHAAYTSMINQHGEPPEFLVISRKF